MAPEAKRRRYYQETETRSFAEQLHTAEGRLNLELYCAYLFTGSVRGVAYK